MVQIRELSGHGFPVLLRRVVHDKLGGRIQAQVVDEEFCQGQGVLGIRGHRELLRHDAGLKEEVGVSLNQIVVIALLVRNDALHLIRWDAGILAEGPQELAGLKGAHWQVRPVQEGNPEALFHALHGLDPHPGGD